MAAHATANTARRRRLVQRRKALGLTQEDLAQLLAVERTTVVRWERGQSDPLPWIRPKLARALRVSAERLESLLTRPGHSGLEAAGVPHQLPAAVADFIGRAAELTALTQILDSSGEGTPGTVVISAIGGMAGVGKTTLALYWAHQTAARFPDGQLYVNLRGFDPAGPVTSGEAIRGFLDALGMAPERVPASPEAQTGLYRSLLAQRQMLLVLDNARDEQQVRPLLPASPGTLVLVTSRNQLCGLAATGGAQLVSLDVLTQDEATQLLSARVGLAGAAADPEALAEIARLCARLPLALAVAAARAVTQPCLPLVALAAELRDTPARLDAFDSGDAATSVQAVFSWSYQQLSSDAARMFRLLGIHPGPDITAPAAASLGGIPAGPARRPLSELTRAHLLNEHLPGRYALHDLLRAYAAELAAAIDRDDVRHAALSRVLDHYLHTAHAGALLINRSRDPIIPPSPQLNVTSERLRDHQHALGWFDAEYQVLLAAVTLADRNGFDVHAWQIPWTMADFLRRRGHSQEKVAVQSIALEAATRLGDADGQAASLRLLANAYAKLGDYHHALTNYAASLKLCQQLGDLRGEAKVHQHLAVVAEDQGRYTDTLSHAEEALRLFRADSHRPGEVYMLNNVGFAHALLGDYDQVRAFCQQALDLSAELGLRDVEAHAWDSLGYAQHHLGNLAEAATCYERALGLQREFGDLRKEAAVRTKLGDIHWAAGEPHQARDAWQQALAILDDLHHPSADQVRAKLAGQHSLRAQPRSADSSEPTR